MKNKKSFKQKVVDKLITKMQPYIQNNVAEFEKTIVIDCCNRIYALLNNKIDIRLLNSVISDLQNGGYKNDKKELV